MAALVSFLVCAMSSVLMTHVSEVYAPDPRYWALPGSRHGACRTTRPGDASLGTFKYAANWGQQQHVDCTQACWRQSDCIAYEFSTIVSSNRKKYTRCELHTNVISHVFPVAGFVCYVKKRYAGSSIQVAPPPLQSPCSASTCKTAVLHNNLPSSGRSYCCDSFCNTGFTPKTLQPKSEKRCDKECAKEGGSCQLVSSSTTNCRAICAG
mmetsp:Transcript_31409/g.51987  ORF Transcript_31409/g.51987 Transcript_31409/m.51987 type:complete len:209 (-) Transcript_31409:297-923(-)